MSSDKHPETGPDSPLTFDLPDPGDLPAGVDRRTFLMQTALVGSAAVLSGCGTPVPAPKVEAQQVRDEDLDAFLKEAMKLRRSQNLADAALS